MTLKVRRNVSWSKLWSELAPLLRHVLAREDSCASVRVCELVYKACVCEPALTDVLWTAVCELVETHCEAVRDRVAGSLSAYASEWATFMVGSTNLSRLCRALNDARVELARASAPAPGAWSVGECQVAVRLHCMVAWHRIVFQAHEPAMVGEAARIVQALRDGTLANDGLARVAAFVASVAALGSAMNPTASVASKKATAFYSSVFENAYVSETHAYYSREAAAYLGENGIIAYMHRAKLRIEEEAQRAHQLLDASSLDRVVAVVDATLVAAHAGVIEMAATDALQRGDSATLGLGVHLCTRLQHGLADLCARIKQLAVREASGALGALDAAQRNEPRAFAETMALVCQRLESTVHGAVRAGSAESDLLLRSLEQGYASVINAYNVGEKALPRAPELLAKYSHAMLSKGPQAVDGAELDAKVRSVMLLFKLIDDKDVYQKFYARLLAKRLVGETSISDDAEKQMLGELRSICGFEFTAKLQRMFQDIGTSRDVSNAFNDSRAKGSLTHDVTMLVLTAGAWPLSTSSQPFAVPAMVERSEAMFRDFYASQHQGRRLTFLYNLSKAEVRTRGWARRYEVTCTAYQMAVMLLFNEMPVVTHADAARHTLLTPDDVDAALRALVAAQLVVVSSGSADAKDAEFAVNRAFKSKRLRIRLVGQTVAAEKQESSATRDAVNDDRKHFLRAVIVRVMKARKRLSHQQLLAEVLQHARDRFAAPVSLIKLCIDQLVSQEYLRRDDADKTVFHYVA